MASNTERDTAIYFEHIIAAILAIPVADGKPANVVWNAYCEMLQTIRLRDGAENPTPR